MKYKEDEFTWTRPAQPNGQNLINERQHKGLTQTQLADMVGVKVRQVQRWEAGTSNPSKASMKQLSKILGENWHKWRIE